MPEGPSYPPAPFPEPQPWGPETVVVGDRAARRRTRRSRVRRRLLGSAAAVLSLTLVGAGSLYAVDLLSGGGTQPEEVVPADALAFVKLDLDPPAGQKIDAFRFLRNFPELKDGLGEDADLHEALYRAVSNVDEDLDRLDYQRDVKPWLGDRAGVALLPSEKGGGDPRPVIALQVTDEDKARDGLQAFAKDAGSDGGGYVVSEGYALLAEDVETARQAADEAARESMADKPEFVADVEALGERGVALSWADMGRLQEQLVDAAVAKSPDKASGEDLKSLRDLLDESATGGRVAFTARFAPRHAEVVGRTFGAEAVAEAASQPNRIGRLPESTAAAVSVTSGGTRFADSWDRFQGVLDSPDGAELKSGLDRLRADYGLALPDDVVTLLGEQAALTLQGGTGIYPRPQLGLVAVNDRAGSARVLEKVEALLRDLTGAPFPVDPTWKDDTMVLATDPDYRDELAAEGSTLDADSDFRAALPDAENADVAVWVDSEQIMDSWSQEIDDDTLRDTFNSIGAFGLTTDTTPGGDSTFRLRVVAD